MPVRAAVEKSHVLQPNISNRFLSEFWVSTSHCAVCALPLLIHHSPIAGRNSEMEAFIETTETPDFIVTKVNRATHSAVGGIRWFGSLLECNNHAKDGDHIHQMILSGSVLFGLESLSMLD
jgi:hypothetical protein